MLLFGEEGGSVTPFSGGVIGALIILIPVLAAEFIRLMKAKKETEKEARADTIQEWKEYTDRLQKDIDHRGEVIEGQQKQITNLQQQVFTIQESEKDCLRKWGSAVEKTTKQEGIINQLTNDVRRLQAITKDTHPGIAIPVVITATMEGVIMDVTAGSGPLLHWLPSDLRGKNINLLVPERLKDAYYKAMNEINEGSRKIDTGRSIRTFAKIRDGGEVEVVITLSHWNSPKGSDLITAEIRQVPSVIDQKEMNERQEQEKDKIEEENRRYKG